MAPEQQLLNEEMEDIKRVKTLEDSYLMINIITKTIKTESKNKKLDFSLCY